MKGLGLLFVVVMVNSGDKPYLIEDGTCNDINHRPCCKRLIELYQKNLESQNRFEYPKCRPDGYYESKQCTDERETPTGWLADCTCVDENGEELLKLDDSYALCPIKGKQSYNHEHKEEGSFSSTNVKPMYFFFLLFNQLRMKIHQRRITKSAPLMREVLLMRGSSLRQ